MRTVKEIDKQIQKENDYIVQLYAQINFYEQSVEHLKAERQDVEKKENKMFIDNWLCLLKISLKIYVGNLIRMEN